ncbi:MAG: hypothetical protein RLZZ511_1165 [Cyanobacteriota bacterium]|jgi:hypothetical protein
MMNQWDCFLQNLGAWQGSFTTYSPDGVEREDIPSLLTLEQVPDRQAVKLVLKRDSPKHPAPLEMEFASLSRSLLFFETGAFSQGAMQLAPGMDRFGGEFAIVTPDRRLRTVILYNAQNELDYVTLIREQRLGSAVPERPPLQADDLVGEWVGESITLFPDWRAPETGTSQMKITRSGDRLDQTLQFGERTITTEAVIEGDRLVYPNSPLNIQILLLPDGASVNTPRKVTLGHPVVLETGWLRSPTQRERIIRSFNPKGEWVGLTLVQETKVA